MKAIISLGSNIDKEKNLPLAIEKLRRHPVITVTSTSPVYETVALDCAGLPSGQPSFHNAAVLVETELTPWQLRTELRAIETQLGRIRSVDKFASRTIDLDIAMVGNTIVVIDGKEIPDADTLRHPHVVLPLADVAPDWNHPTAGIKLGQIVADLDINETEIVRL